MQEIKKPGNEKGYTQLNGFRLLVYSFDQAILGLAGQVHREGKKGTRPSTRTHPGLTRFIKKVKRHAAELMMLARIQVGRRMLS
jgi:hypothetical protein